MIHTVARAAPGSPDQPGSGDGGGRLDPVVIALGVVAAVLAALAGCHPAGWAPVDVVLTAAMAAVVTLAAARARSWTWAVLVVPAVLLASGWWLAVGVVAAVVVAVALLRPPPRRWQGALVAALTVQVLVRLPDPSVLGSRRAGVSALAVAAVLAPVLISGARTLSGVGRRRLAWVTGGVVVFVGVATVGLGVAAVAARSGLQRGQFHAERGLDAAKSADEARAADELDQSAAAFAQARSRLTAPWAWPSRLVPVLGHYAAAGALAADAGYDVAAAGARTARQVPYDQLSPKDGKVDLALLRSAAQPVDDAATALERATARVDGLDTTWLLPPVANRLDELRYDLTKTVPEARRAADAVKLAPALLGGSGTRHYLLLFANPAEARPLGGYVGAYGELVATDGKLELARSGRTADLQLPADAAATPDPAGFESRYSRYQLTSHLGNVSASPDFGAVAAESARLYGSALGTHFDGVVEVDPYGLAALLKLTGPIAVEGVPDPLTEHTLASFLVQDQYTTFGDRADRFDFLTEASTATFRKLTNASLPEPRRAFEALYPAVASGRLRFVAFAPEEGRLLEEVGLTGVFPDPVGGDLLSLRSSNVSPNKTDAFVHRSMTYELTVDPRQGTVDGWVTVHVTNDAPLNLPAYVLSNRDLQEGRPGARPFGSNSSLLSIYSPLGLDAAQLDGNPVAMSAETDGASHVYATVMTVPAGGSSELRLHLRGTVSLDGGYRLTLAHQPTVNDDHVTVIVHGPDAETGARRQELDLTSDQVLTFAG